MSELWKRTGIALPKISDIKFYQHSYNYAVEHNEVDAFRSDRDVRNTALKLFKIIVFDNYKDNVFNSKVALDKMQKQIGNERTKAIVCSTVNAVTNRWDKRYTNAVYEWAAASEYDFKDLISIVHPYLINALAERMMKGD